MPDKASTVTERMVERIVYAIIMALLATFAGTQTDRAATKAERLEASEAERTGLGACCPRRRSGLSMSEGD